jgi:hypothetical protein
MGDGVTSELRHMRGNVEFLGRLLRAQRIRRRRRAPSHRAAVAGAVLADRCRLHAQHSSSAMAYSVGRGRAVRGAQSLGRGEIKEYSDVFSTTRHWRCAASARRRACQHQRGDRHRDPHHAVRGVPRCSSGTAPIIRRSGRRRKKRHPAHTAEPVAASHLQEMRNLASLGLMPQARARHRGLFPQLRQRVYGHVQGHGAR